jgi:Raf kinase inhibitor-like YbhB/YbcL family protein
MKSAILFSIVVTSLVAALTAMAQGQQNSNDDWDHHHKFQLTSTTFSRGGTFPLSMVAGSNLCSFFSGGLDESPELAWSNAPGGTRTFVVILYDVVAGFTHWGMYNIPATTTKLPENAGIPNSPYGQQIANDFGDENYDGPCPPPTLSPPSHHYVFTVYALDVTLPTLPAHGDFPPFPEGLYHLLIRVGRHGHILDKASIDGFFPAPD